MTTLAIVVGSIPVAIGIGEGSEFRRGLSIVLIGGLLTSTVLTLLVVPTAYSLLESFTRKASGLFRRRPRPQPAMAAPSAGVAHTDLPADDHTESNGWANGVAAPLPANVDETSDR